MRRLCQVLIVNAPPSHAPAHISSLTRRAVLPSAGGRAELPISMATPRVDAGSPCSPWQRGPLRTGLVPLSGAVNHGMSHYFAQGQYGGRDRNESITGQSTRTESEINTRRDKGPRGAHRSSRVCHHGYDRWSSVRPRDADLGCLGLYGTVTNTREFHPESMTLHLLV